MLKARINTATIQHILVICVILFAFNPCTIKEAFFELVKSDYNKPLNKSRTTVPTNSCEYSQNLNQQNSVVSQSEIIKLIEPVDFLKRKEISSRLIKVKNDYSKTFSGNSPPKYILYKRLKIDLA